MLNIYAVWEWQHLYVCALRNDYELRLSQNLALHVAS